MPFATDEAPGESSRFDRFLERLGSDQDGAGRRPLEDYLAEFPDIAAAVAREYLRIEKLGAEAVDASVASIASVMRAVGPTAGSTQVRRRYAESAGRTARANQRGRRRPSGQTRASEAAFHSR